MKNKTPFRTSKKSFCFHLSPLVAGVRFALGGVLVSALSPNLLANESLPQAASNWVGSGAATKAIDGAKMQINQHTDKVLLNWKTFNVGEGHHVDFAQPSASSVALNRINGSTAPSQILGTLTANGQIHLIDPNGIIFGKNSVVNVNSLLASTHNITDEALENGFTRVFDDNGQAAMTLEANAFKANTNELKEILIQEGADISVADNSNVIIVAPKVTNQGDISAGDFGQIMLVASQDKVYLQQADSDDFKGLLVEVDTGGEVTNFGHLLADQGNITMAGFIVNQSGKVNATTSVTVNGSVRLQAREGQQKIGNTLTGVRTTRAFDSGDGLGTEATVNLQNGRYEHTLDNGQTEVVDTHSQTHVTPSTARGEDIDAQQQPASYVELTGHTIEFHADSELIAPGAKVLVQASETMPVGSDDSTPGSARIIMQQGAVLDVSGNKNVDVAMQRNVGVIDARSSFVFRDSPNQKDGILFGEKELLVDLRKSTDFIDAQGPKDRVKASVYERLATGGAVSMTATGDVAIHDGALIDISGGSVKYLDGEVTTTQLFNESGKQFDISDADPLDVYVGFENQTHFQQGYTEGRDAGSLAITTANLDWQGQLNAAAVQGQFQRSGDTQAKGGRLNIDLAKFRTVQHVAFQSANAMAKLALSGAQEFSLKTLGDVNIAADTQMHFTPFSTVTVEAGHIRHDGDLYSAGGDIKLVGKQNKANNQAGDVILGEQAVIDVSGRWVNDALLTQQGFIATQSLAIDAGKISVIAGGDVVTGEQSRLLADGGAQNISQQQQVAGKGGEIKLLAGFDESAGALFEDGHLLLQGDMSALSMSQNGSLILGESANAIVDNQLPTQRFSKIKLESFKGTATIAENTQLDFTQLNRQFEFAYDAQDSQRSMQGFTQLTQLPQIERASSEFELVAQNDILMSAGSSILTEAGGQVSFTSKQAGIFVDGAIVTPAGDINMTLLAKDSGNSFDATRSIWLGENAQLNAQGVALLEPFTQPFSFGKVLDGGRVNLTAERGYIVAENGAVINVSGTSAQLDIVNDGSASFGYQKQGIGSDGGEVNLFAAEGMLLEGQMLAQGGSATNFNGRLNVELSRSRRADPSLNAEDKDNPFPKTALLLSVQQNINNPLSDALSYGDRLDAALNSATQLAANDVTAAGFDFITLKSDDSIGFNGDVTLSAGVAITLDAASYAATLAAGQTQSAVNLQAKYINLGSSRNLQAQHALLAGASIFTASADWMEVFGGFSMNGFEQINLHSHNDMQLVANHFSGENDFSGELVTLADISLQASKIYPSSFSRFRFAVENNPDGRITIANAAGNKASPLAAGGEVTFQAATIEHGGNVQAPLGTINFNADKALILADDSVTSTSADGLLIPLGNVIDGQDWLYPLSIGGAPYQSVKNLVVKATENAKLDKQIVLQAPDIAVHEGARVDLAGGGDIFAYEFIPGIGGSNDYLQFGSPSYQDSFAVLPTLGSTYAAFDHFQSQSAQGQRYYANGETVVLNDSANGLAAGEYAKLPAHYALLPGAYLVTPVSNTQDHGLTTATVDARPIVSGFSQIAGTGKRDSRSGGFMIENGAQVGKQSEYQTYTGDAFFTAKAEAEEADVPLLARDGGLVSILAQTRLQLDGLFNIGAPNGISARMDIAANNIRVTDSLSATPVDGVLEILGSDLTDLNLASLLLGGQRQTGAAEGESVIAVSADNVSFEDGSMLDVADLIVAAKHAVTVKKGAVVAASSATANNDQLLTVAGDGALLRVSAAQQVDINRTGSSGAQGDLIVEQGAVLQAAQSMLLDSSRTTDIAGQIEMQGGSLNLATNRINIGQLEGVADSNALNLSNAQLGAMAVDELVLTSRDAVYFYGNTAVVDGNGLFQQATGGLLPHQIKHLSFNAAGLIGMSVAGSSASDSVNLAVNQLTLKNTLKQINSLPASGAGSLNIAANTVSTGDGEFKIDGFNTLNLTASQQFRAQGVGSMDVNADFNMATAMLGADSRGDYQLNATGHHAEFSRIGSAPAQRPEGLTGELAIAADSVLMDTRVDMASGSLTVTANNGDVHVGENAVLNLSGRETVFADKTVASTGGKLTLISKTGDVRLAANSTLNLDGGNSQVEGGRMQFTAEQGNVELEGLLTAKNGSIAIDSNGAVNQTQFDGVLDTIAAAGINKAISYRSRVQDIVLAAGQTITAEQVKLVADQGAVSIAGNINADAQTDSQVDIIAEQHLTLASSATVSARTATAGQGGQVSLSSRDSVGDGIRIAQGAHIDVGDAQNKAGNVVLRAARADNKPGGINISEVAGTINGIEEGGFYAQGVKVYQDADGKITSTDINQYKNDAAALMSSSHRQAVTQLHSKLKLQPLAEVQYNGDLEISNEIDTVSWRYAPLQAGDEAEVGQLVFRASGDIDIKQNVSDGYKSKKLTQDDSWGFQLVSGAGLSSPDVTALNGAGDINIASGVIVRSGTGDIKLHAAGDINFAASDSVVYSAGRQNEQSAYGTIKAAYEFPEQGGDVELIALGDINGKQSDQFINDWLSRQGNWKESGNTARSKQTAWGVVVKKDEFEQSIGSFGGGRVHVSAGGDLNDVSVMMPTTGRQLGKRGKENIVEINGGGTLNVQADGNINGGGFLLGQGQATISAGQSIQGGQQFRDGPVFALGDAQLSLLAGDDVNIAAVVDPMVLHSNVNFFSYTENTTLNVTSLAGNVYLGANDEQLRSIMGYNSVQSSLAKIYPGSLNATALDGSILVKDNLTLFPSAQGQLNLLAKQDVRPEDTSGGKLNIGMSDADPTLLTGWQVPANDNALNDDNNRLSPFTVGQPLLIHAATPLHSNDHEPVRIVTQQGNIDNFQMNVPKKVRIQAGNDLTRMKLHVQHVNADDFSVIETGRDLSSASGRDVVTGSREANNDFVEVAGPGQVLIKTGRHVDLGRSEGIVTVGNAFNPALSSQGADLNILSGVGDAPDYYGFVRQLQKFAEDNAGNSLIENAFFSQVAAIDVDALQQQGMPLEQLNQQMLPLFFEALRSGGVAEGAGNVLGNQLAYTAIDSLFPGEQWQGDMKMVFSRIQTLAGGNVHLVAPGGDINVGLSTVDDSKDASELGIVAQQGGEVAIYLGGNIDVNQSRVFAIGGDDILIFSGEGDVDAGRGAKSAISAPPPVIQYDPVTGGLIVIFPPNVSGNGIQTVGNDSIEAGDIFLFAPKGEINAGEAGIAGNNVVLVAKAVIGSDNIDVGGFSVGVQVQTASAAPTAGLSNSTASVSQAAEKAVQNDSASEDEASVALGMLSVEVVDYGTVEEEDEI